MFLVSERNLLLGRVENQVVERKSGLHIVDVASLHRDFDELQQGVRLFGRQFNFNHAAGASTIESAVATFSEATAFAAAS